MTLALSGQTCDWNTAIEEFLLDMEATRAKNTHIFYSTQLRSLRAWAEGEGIALTDFRKSHLNRYLIFRTNEGKQPTTVTHGAGTAKSFFRWCVANDLLQRDPLAEYRVRNAPSPARPKCMPYRGDARAEDRRLQRGRTPYLDTRIEGKATADTPRFSGLGLCSLHLASYAATDHVWKTRDGLLFVSELGGPIDTHKFIHTLHSITKYAGLSEGITLHSLRRYSINKLAKNNLLAAQTIAGHKDAKTTLLYTRLDPDFLRDVHSEVGVLDKVIESKREKRRRLV